MKTYLYIILTFLSTNVLARGIEITTEDEKTALLFWIFIGMLFVVGKVVINIFDRLVNNRPNKD